MILLDTDHITLIQNGGASAASIERRLMAKNAATLSTSIITYEEQMRGWMSELSRGKSIRDEIQVYGRLHTLLRFYSMLTIVDFDGLAATEFQRLRSLKIRIGTMDLKIAAIALANQATLFTRNAIDFARVPGLHIEDGTR